MIPHASGQSQVFVMSVSRNDNSHRRIAIPPYTANPPAAGMNSCRERGSSPFTTPGEDRWLKSASSHAAPTHITSRTIDAVTTAKLLTNLSGKGLREAAPSARKRSAPSLSPPS